MAASALPMLPSPTTPTTADSHVDHDPSGLVPPFVRRSSRTACSARRAATPAGAPQYAAIWNSSSSISASVTPVRADAARVEPELLHPPERGGHRHHEQAPVARRQGALPRPHPPRHRRDVVLELAVTGSGSARLAVDVLVAEHGRRMARAARSSSVSSIVALPQSSDEADRLHLGVLVQRLEALLAPVAAPLEPAERRLDGEGAAVHRHLAGVDPLGHPQPAGDVAAPHARHQAVLGVVGPGHGVGLVGERASSRGRGRTSPRGRGAPRAGRRRRRSAARTAPRPPVRRRRRRRRSPAPGPRRAPRRSGRAPCRYCASVIIGPKSTPGSSRSTASTTRPPPRRARSPRRAGGWWPSTPGRR